MMMKKYLQPIIDYIESDENKDYDADFACIQYDIVENMEADNIGKEAIEPIIQLMEQYPLIEFGTPGALTHFIESFYDENPNEYETILLNSIKTKPSVHTIWLLNRVINGSENEKALKLIEIMESISNDNKIDKEIRNVAVDFLNVHKE